MAKIKIKGRELPLWNAMFIPGGFTSLALVDEPASMIDFIMLSAKNPGSSVDEVLSACRSRLSKIQKFNSSFISVDSSDRVLLEQNHVKREITGVVLRADFPIYRSDTTLGEGFFKMSSKYIEQVMMDAIRTGSINKLTLNHGGKPIKNVWVKSLWQVTKENPYEIKGISIEPGSYMVTLKALTTKAWNDLKESSVNGFSPDLFVRLHGTGEKIKVNFSINQLKKSIMFGNKKSKDSSSKVQLERNKAAKNLLKLQQDLAQVVELAEVATDKGVLQTLNTEDETIEVNTPVVLVAEDGTASVPPDGDYTAEDGTVYTVVFSETEGTAVVDSITEADEEAATEEEFDADFKKKMDAYLQSKGFKVERTVTAPNGKKVELGKTPPKKPSKPTKKVEETDSDTDSLSLSSDEFNKAVQDAVALQTEALTKELNKLKLNLTKVQKPKEVVSLKRDPIVIKSLC